MKPNDSAYPLPEQRGKHNVEFGLTIRDYIAIEAMKALIPSAENKFLDATVTVSKRAYEYADMLIMESNKKV